MKIHPQGAELFHEDGHEEARSRFSHICDGALKHHKTKWRTELTFLHRSFTFKF